MLSHVCLEHTGLAITDVNCGICRPAVCLLSVRCGAKASGVEATIQDELSFIATFMQ